MWLHVIILFYVGVGCLSNVITEYKYLQQDGDFTELDMLQCQLKANGNSSCAVRLNTTDGISEGHIARCEQLNVDWCHTTVMEPGFTYSEKYAVIHRPPFEVSEGVGATDWLFSETIPIAVKQGVQLTVELTLPSTWDMIRLYFKSASGSDLYIQEFQSTDVSPLPTDVKTTIKATFDTTTSIKLNVNGLVYYSGSIGPVSDIRIFQLMFYTYPGEIHLMSYKQTA